jgi:hypothetical protein
VLLWLQRSCSSSPEITEPQVITKVEVRYDTVETIKETYVPKYITRIETVIDTFTTPIDTVNILKNYYAKYFYSDTLKIDTLGYAVINDTITQNTILARDIRTNVLIPTTTITKEIYLNNREFYWGLGLQGKKDQLNYLGGELLYRNKKYQVYGLGVGVNENLQPVISGRLYWKIGN